MGPSLGEWILSLKTGSINGGKGHNLAWTASFASFSLVLTCVDQEGPFLAHLSIPKVWVWHFVFC